MFLAIQLTNNFPKLQLEKSCKIEDLAIPWHFFYAGVKTGQQAS